MFERFERSETHWRIIKKIVRDRDMALAGLQLAEARRNFECGPANV